MKVVINVPDTTQAIALNYIYKNEFSGETMINSRIMVEDDIKAAKVKEDYKE